MTTTVRRVAPAHRSDVPPAQAERLAAAKVARDAAETEFRASVVAALKANGSIRSVSEISGLSTRTVQDWGHAAGWPTKAQKRARVEAKERRREELREQLAKWDAEREGK